MSLVIRLKRAGTKSRKQWRVVVADSRMPRDGRLIEELGSYNPLVNPPAVRLRMDRYAEWVQKGAKPSPTVRSLVKREKKSGRAN